jgi:hypothetical protein
VIVDDNSFAIGPEETISLDTDASCKAFTWLTDRAGVMLMYGNRLTITSEMTLSSDYFATLDGGGFEFNGTGIVNIQKGSLHNDTLIFRDGSWEVNGLTDVYRIDVENAELKLPPGEIKIRQLIGDAVAKIHLTETKVTELEFSKLVATTLVSEEAVIVASDATVFDWTIVEYDGKLIVPAGAELSLYSDNTNVLDSLIVDGTVRLFDQNTVYHLEGNAGAKIYLAEGKTQNISGLDLLGTEGNPVEISSMTNTNATIRNEKREKMCFDYLKVVDIDIISESVFNAGPHSELLGSDDWLAMECDDALFADFVVGNPCAHGLTIFIDQSIGSATEWEWNFGDSQTSNDRNVNHQYLNAGTYPVTLTISNSIYSVSYTRDIEILPTDLANTIVQNGFVVVSQQTAEAYQWYLNGEIVDGATNRTLVFDEPGSYQLLTTVEDCNYFTDPFIILSAEDVAQQTFTVYPNPTASSVKIRFKDSKQVHQVMITSAMGQRVMATQTQHRELEVNVEGFASGIYIVEVDGRKQKLVVQR